MIRFLIISVFCITTFETSNLMANSTRDIALKQWINSPKQFSDWKARVKSTNTQDLSAFNKMTQDSEHAQYIAAVIEGDYAELLSLETELKTKESVAKVLFRLLEQSKTIPALYRQYLRNEYYYHSGQFQHQYLLGCEDVAAGRLGGGSFSKGVGASEYAYQKLKAGDKEEAKRLATIAARSWEIHAREVPDWTFPYPYFYIQALYIAGEELKARTFYKELKNEERYKLKKPIYDKYDRRIAWIKKQ